MELDRHWRGIPQLHINTKDSICRWAEFLGGKGEPVWEHISMPEQSSQLFTSAIILHVQMICLLVSFVV